MTKREKILSICAGGLVVGVIGWFVSGYVTDSFDQSEAQIVNLQREINQKKITAKEGEIAAEQLEEWRKHSLSSDLGMAHASYQRWLMSLVEKTKLADANVDSGRITAISRTGTSGKRQVVYHVLPYNVSGQGSVDQLSDFLYEFYQLDHLHQITRMNIVPLTKSKNLDMVISIEAISFPEANPDSNINQGSSELLAYNESAKYKVPISKRNFFAEYVPPPPPRKPPPVRRDPPKVVVKPKPPTPKPPSFDPGKFAYITAIIAVGGKQQVWINARSEGKTMRIFEGDSLKIGWVEGKVLSIGEKDVIVELDGKRWLLALGENLREGALLPDGDI